MSITNRLSMTDLRLSTLPLGNFDIFHRFWYTNVAHNKTMKVSKASGVSKAGEVSQPVWEKRAGAGGPVQANSTVKSHLSFSTFMLWHLTLVGHFKSIMLKIPSRSYDIASIKSFFGNSDFFIMLSIGSEGESRKFMLQKEKICY